MAFRSLFHQGSFWDNRPTHRINRHLDFFFLPVQKTQIALPPDRENAREHEPVVRHDEPERKRRHSGPQLERVHKTDWHSSHDAGDDSRGRLAGQKGLHPKEVSVEDGRKDDLVNGNFGRDGANSGREVEITAEKEEPDLSVSLLYSFGLDVSECDSS